MQSLKQIKFDAFENDKPSASLWLSKLENIKCETQFIILQEKI